MEISEARKRFLSTKARSAFETARLFMSSEDMEIIEYGDNVYNMKVDDFLEIEFENGFNSSDANTPRGRCIEDKAMKWVCDNIAGYKKALYLYTDMIGSLLEQE